MSSKTSIQKFFDGKSIFITGGTGLVGNLLIEKLLRTCSDIGKIYILIREKWNNSCENRFEELRDATIFNNIKENNPNQLKKLIPIKGRLEETNVGISFEEWNLLKEEVNCIFHVGASVRFEDSFSDLLKSNVYGTQEITKLATEVKNLQSFIYVSSTYAHCTKETVNEIFYQNPMTSEGLLLLAETIGNEKLNKISKLFLEDFPNAYTYSKHVAEDFLRRTAHNLPLAIIRPSIVSATLKKPFPGWANSAHSFSNFVAMFGCGIGHVFFAKQNNIFDLVPADVVVNHIIAASWEIGTTWSHTNKHIRIYNCASSHLNPLSYRKYEELVSKHDAIFPSNQKFWHRFIIMSTNTVILRFFYYLQLPQMYFLDFVSFLLGKRQTCLKVYKKSHRLVNLVLHFTKNSWLFKADNTKRLWNKLNEDDKKIFNFDIQSIDWDTAISNYVQGIRCFILKEDPITIPTALFRLILYSTKNSQVVITTALGEQKRMRTS